MDGGRGLERMRPVGLFSYSDLFFKPPDERYGLRLEWHGTPRFHAEDCGWFVSLTEPEAGHRYAFEPEKAALRKRALSGPPPGRRTMMI